MYNGLASLIRRAFPIILIFFYLIADVANRKHPAPRTNEIPDASSDIEKISVTSSQVGIRVVL